MAGSGRQLDTDEHGYPNLSLYNVSDGREYNNPNNQQIGNHLSIIKGSHNLKMGGEVYRLTMHDGAANLGRGRVRWSGNETGLNHASFLMGIPSSTETPEGVAITSPVAIRQGYYIQDDWKFSPRLTINMGFRFDYDGNIRDRLGFLRTVLFPNENHAPGTAVGNGGFIDPDTGIDIPTMGPPAVGSGGDVKLFHQDVRFFMPRLGIAYRPSEKWVVRIGAGYFDNLMHWNNWSILNLNPPLAAATEFIQSVDVAQTLMLTGLDGTQHTVRTRRFRNNDAAITLNDPFLDNVGGALPSNLGNPVNTVAVNPETKDGDMWKWSFDIQRDLGYNTQFDRWLCGPRDAPRRQQYAELELTRAVGRQQHPSESAIPAFLRPGHAGAWSAKPLHSPLPGYLPERLPSRLADGAEKSVTRQVSPLASPTPTRKRTATAKRAATRVRIFSNRGSAATVIVAG